MNERGQHSSPRWLLPLIVVALIAGPLILYTLPHTGVPVALASGVVMVMALTHLGVLAVLLTPVYVLLRRRPQELTLCKCAARSTCKLP